VGDQVRVGVKLLLGVAVRVSVNVNVKLAWERVSALKCGLA